MSSKRYKCPYCDNRYERNKLVDHIDDKHEDLIPQDYTATRVVFNLINKRDTGYCRVCHKETKWREDLGRYDVLCDNPKCKEAVRKLYQMNMIRARGTDNILTDPEQQKKMLAARKISGRYKFKDGGVLTYTGSYEKECLEFMDKGLDVPSKDILSPAPTIVYKYNGEDHIYIPDFYLIPQNLIIEVKDGGSNPNTRNSNSDIDSHERTLAKERAVKEAGKYNYIRLTNNEFAQLVNVLMEIKKSQFNEIDSRIMMVNESTIQEADNTDHDDRENVYLKTAKVLKDNGIAFKVDEESLKKFIDYEETDFGYDLCISVGVDNVNKAVGLVNPEISSYGGKLIADNYGTVFLSLKEGHVHSSYISLYHGTDLPNLDIILPNSYNIGTKLSRPRMSSYWFDNYKYAKVFAIMTVLDNRLPKDGGGRCCLTNEMKIAVPVEYRKETMNILKRERAYVYNRLLDKSIVDRGHARYFPEYTVDVPVKPDGYHEVDKADMLSTIIFVSREEYDRLMLAYTHDAMEFHVNKIQKLFDSLVKYDQRTIWSRTKQLKKLAKQTSFAENTEICINQTTTSQPLPVQEACKDVVAARKFVKDVGKLAKKYNANYFIVTDGASGTHNDGTNPVVRHMRDEMKDWERNNGFNPDEDWANNIHDMSDYRLTEASNDTLLEISRGDIQSEYLENGDSCFNLNLWDSSTDNNILYITGISGGGKTTLGIAMAEEFNAQRVELDYICVYYMQKTKDRNNYNKVYNMVYAECPIATEFFKLNPLDKYGYPEKFKDTEPVFNDFINWFVSKVSGDGNLYIINGAQISLINVSYFYNRPIIIKDINYIKTVIRRVSREFNFDNSFKDNITYAIKALKTGLSKSYRDANKEYKTYRSDLKKNAAFMEQAINEAGINRADPNWKLSGHVTEDDLARYIKDASNDSLLPYSESKEGNYTITYTDRFNDVLNIVNSLSKQELNNICNGTFKNSPFIIARKVLLINGEPAAFIDAYSIPGEMNSNEVCIVCATKKKFRGNGYISILFQQILPILKSSNIDTIYWETTKNNKTSSSIARNLGFKPGQNINKDDDNYYMVLESSYLFNESSVGCESINEIGTNKKDIEWDGFKPRNIRYKLNKFKMETSSYNMAGYKTKKVEWYNADTKVATCIVDTNKKPYWIYDLEVSPEYRGNGLSYQVLDYAVKTLKGTALTVKRDNEIAIHIYKKYGFKIDPKCINNPKAKKDNVYYMYLDGSEREVLESTDLDLFLDDDLI